MAILAILHLANWFSGLNGRMVYTYMYTTTCARGVSSLVATMKKHHHTVLVTIKLPLYTRATGMSTGVARVRIWVQYRYGYERARSTATGVERLQL